MSQKWKSLEYSRVKEMEGVKGPEVDHVNKSTVLKVHLNKSQKGCSMHVHHYFTSMLVSSTFFAF